MIKKYISEIKKNGFVKINNFLSKSEINKAITLVENYNKKSKTIKFKGLPKRDKNDKMVYNLQNKNIFFIKILSKKAVLDVGMHFLNDPYYRYLPKSKPNFNLLYYNARSSGNKLELHIDSHIPFKGERTTMMQFVFLLEDSTILNGCTTAVKGSHKSGKFSNRSSKKIIPIPGKAGDLIIWDSRLWHGTLPNISGQSRWAMVATLGMWWIKPMMNFYLTMPNNIYKKCSNLQKQLLGFCSIPPKDETERINTKCGYEFLKKNLHKY
jgi:ectoine hydroxylase-related dioxygenase (phytanoyl-CoA dioxygenase family)